MRLLRCFLLCQRWQRTQGRFHHPARAGQSCRAQPYPQAAAGSRPAGTGVSEFPVVHRIQSTAQDHRLSVSRPAGGSQAAVSKTARGLAGLLTFYKRLISPVLPSACRFHPTCSVYMREAVLQHGPVKGVWMGLQRLGRCHPFHAGGNDPVPRRIL